MNVSLVKSLLELQFVDWETLLGTRSLGLHITSVIEDLHRTAQLGPSILSLINDYACVPDEHLTADYPDGLYLAAREELSVFSRSKTPSSPHCCILEYYTTTKYE